MNAIPQLESRISVVQAFSTWADAYDQQQNPLLTLEERYLLRILPGVQGRDVLDVGCGTGRWLAAFSQLQPNSLHGVDPSPEMLTQAAAKHIPHVRLYNSSCTALPLEDASADIVLASFVLSYVDDLHDAAMELARVARPGSDLFLSDMHPETAMQLRWKRSFRTDETEVELPAIRRSITEILDAFRAAGFEERATIEPAFGAREHAIFAAHQRLERFAEAENLPAIYLLHLSKTGLKAKRKREAQWHFLHGGSCVLGPQEKVPASIVIETGDTATVSSHLPTVTAREARNIDLTGYLLFPGLINAHDHLEFALFPRLGRGGYKNTKQWTEDIHRNDAELIASHQKISKRTRLWWGGIRNLLSGVTTVCHHNPMDPCLLAPDFPVRVVSHFGWEHSLAFGTDIQAAHANTAEDQPFILHACEGIDSQTKQELATLHRLGVLDPRTVLVHGLALDQAGAALLNACGASLIACPSSNDFLFGRVPLEEVLKSIERLALGSDSPLTAAGDLLDEIRFIADTSCLSSQTIYSLVTGSAASILRLHHGEGFIRPGFPADFIAVRDQQREPADILCSLSARDIELVLLSGCVQMASTTIVERLPQEDREGLEPLAIDGEIRWLRAPIEALLHEAEDVLGRDAVRIGGRRICRLN